MIYLIDAAGTGLVKIGVSGNVSLRFRGLRTQSPCPLALAANWTGEQTDERALHDRFADCRDHGEWFRFGVSTQQVIDLISEALERAPVALPHVPSELALRTDSAAPAPIPASVREFTVSRNGADYSGDGAPLYAPGARLREVRVDGRITVTRVREVLPAPDRPS